MLAFGGSLAINTVVFTGYSVPILILLNSYNQLAYEVKRTQKKIVKIIEEFPVIEFCFIGSRVVASCRKTELWLRRRLLTSAHCPPLQHLLQFKMERKTTTNSSWDSQKKNAGNSSWSLQKGSSKSWVGAPNNWKVNFLKPTNIISGSRWAK